MALDFNIATLVVGELLALSSIFAILWFSSITLLAEAISLKPPFSFASGEVVVGEVCHSPALVTLTSFPDFISSSFLSRRKFSDSTSCLSVKKSL